MEEISQMTIWSRENWCHHPLNHHHTDQQKKIVFLIDVKITKTLFLLLFDQISEKYGAEIYHLERSVFLAAIFF